MIIKIIGDGVISSGDYEEVKVVGTATSSGDFNTNILRVTGELDSDFNISAETARIVGNCSFNDATMKEVTIVGEVDCSNLESEIITITGDVKASKLKATKINVKGAKLTIDEMNADQLDIRNAVGYVKSIVGEKIKIYRRIKFLIFLTSKKRLSVDEIEGDNIYIEHVDAKKVTGDHIVIGPNCNIEVLDAKTMKIDKSSFVKVGANNE